MTAAVRHLLVTALIALGIALPLRQANATDVVPLQPVQPKIIQLQPIQPQAVQPQLQQNSYRIEMVFFTFNSPSNFNQEIWRQNFPKPDLSKALDLFGGKTSSGFKVLPPSAFALDNAARRLQDSGRYTVIGHVAWIQPGLDVTTAVPISIHLGTDYGPLYPQLMQPVFVVHNGQTTETPAPNHLYQLTGTVKVVLSRYLHLYTDLVLRVPTNPVVAPVQPASSTTSTAALTIQATAPTQAVQPTEDIAVIRSPQNAQPAPGGTLTDVHIKEQRRTRSRLLNYLDHPLVGILFEIWPIGNSR